jgi:hypothetical protein
VIRAWLFAYASLGFSSLAQADPGCAEAYTAAQRLQQAGKLRAARAQALVCAQDVCSTTVRTDCVRWLEDVDRATPSILIDARDESGVELAEVRVEVDGELLAEHLDGRQILVDPGQHGFRFEHRGRVVERRVIIREAEKYRTLRVEFPSPNAAPSPAAPSPTVLNAAPTPVAPSPARPHDPSQSGASLPQSGTSLPVASYALGGVGALGLATFIGLATSAYISEQELRRTCGPTRSCATHAIDSVRTRYLIGDIALGVGTLSLAAALAFWAFTPRARPERDRPAAGLQIAVGAQRSSARLQLSAQF